MIFQFDTKSSTDIPVAFHLVKRVELSTDLARINVYIDSWPSEDSRNSGLAPVASFFITAQIAALDLSGGLLGGITAAVLADPLFAGAVVIPDSSQSIEAMRARKWADILAIRDAHEFGAFTWDGSTFDGDAQSQARIIGGVLWAMRAQQTGATFARAWTLADNSERTLSADDMVAVGVAMGTSIDAVHATSRTLYEQIAAATSSDQVAAIAWPT